jgi:Protein of unknown function (DUF2877)
VAVVLPAHRVATPVLERLTGALTGSLLGAGATAAWVDLGGFVLAVTTREVPLLPNAVALAAGTGALAGVGRPDGAARCAPGRVELGGGLTVTWDPASPPAWDPTVRVAGVPGRPGPHPSSGNYSRSGGTPAGPFGGAAVGRRGEAVLAALGVRAARAPAELVAELARAGLATAVEPDGAVGIELLLRAVLRHDASLAAEAAGLLCGRGPGLTPEGDDLLAAVAATVVTFGPAAGLAGGSLDGMLEALLGGVADGDPGGGGASRQGAGKLAGRTTALAGTLLELAARGQVVEPAGRLLDLSAAGERDWPGALRRLERLGHGSGRAYALGIGAAAWLLAAGGGVG